VSWQRNRLGAWNVIPSSNGRSGDAHAGSDTADADETKAREHAWSVLQAIQTWTSRIETKASFLLTLESALFVFFGSQLLRYTIEQENELVFSQAMVLMLNTYPFAGQVIMLGLGLLLVSIFALVNCLAFPLWEKGRRAEKPSNGIYFGHLESSKEADIIRLFREDQLNQLAREAKRSSSIAWQKQVRLKISTGLTVLGVAVITGTYFFGLALLVGNSA
jgi:hypothetical protein